MVFSSSNFIFNDVNSKGMKIHIVSEDSGVLNDYGIPFNIEEGDTEITLSFCYADGDTPLKWDYDTIANFLEWVITDDYCEFISEDNEDIIYFLKGVSYTKRFTNDMTGIIDVTFKSLSPYGYKHEIREILPNETSFEIYNYSNVDNKYKPVITLNNISSTAIVVKNKTTGKPSFKLSELDGISSVTIDNKMGTIVDSKGSNLLNKSNRSWIELRKGRNSFTVTGGCSLLIESYYPIMV